MLAGGENGDVDPELQEIRRKKSAAPSKPAPSNSQGTPRLPCPTTGTSGGGFITAGYACTHPDQVAGMVFIDTGAPFQSPPREIVEETSPDSPTNVEHRDYLQVERDAWAARKRIGNIPVKREGGCERFDHRIGHFRYDDSEFAVAGAKRSRAFGARASTKT